MIKLVRALFARFPRLWWLVFVAAIWPSSFLFQWFTQEGTSTWVSLAGVVTVWLGMVALLVHVFV